MKNESFHFDKAILQSVVGGESALNLPKLNLHSMAEAEAFVSSYGFNLKEPKEVEKLWYYHRRALVLMQEKLGFKAEEIPEVLRDRKKLENICQLLLWASSSWTEEKHLQLWSCAILRVMHVFVHAENDLFSSFSQEIQRQILSPFQACVVHDGTSGATYLRHSEEGDGIPLLGFEIKPFKTSSSTVIKLLAKPDALAMNVYDKVGVRFITRNMFDVFRVVRFAVSENLMSFPHIMPDQSTNTIYPIDLFMEVCQELAQNRPLEDDEINEFFKKKMDEKSESVQYVRKENSFSGEDYKFIKFICRRLIRIEPQDDREPFSFFYPFEVQIMDKDSHAKILSGPSQHQAYKERQKLAARARLFPGDYK